MLQAIKTFNAGIFSLHPLWQLWVGAMFVVNGIAPLFFLPSLAAIVTLIGMLSAAILGLVLVRAQGFTKLLGAMHMPWVPMVAAQIGLYPGLDGASAFSVWLTASILISAISLIIDGIDVAIYFRESP